MTDRRVPDISFEITIALTLLAIGAFIAAPAWALIGWVRR